MRQHESPDQIHVSKPFSRKEGLYADCPLQPSFTSSLLDTLSPSMQQGRHQRHSTRAERGKNEKGKRRRHVLSLRFLTCQLRAKASAQFAHRLPLFRGAELSNVVKTLKLYIGSSLRFSSSARVPHTSSASENQNLNQALLFDLFAFFLFQ